MLQGCIRWQSRNVPHILLNSHSNWMTNRQLFGIFLYNHCNRYSHTHQDDKWIFHCSHGLTDYGHRTTVIGKGYQSLDFIQDSRQQTKLIFNIMKESKTMVYLLREICTSFPSSFNFLWFVWYPILSIFILQLSKSLTLSETQTLVKKWCVAILRDGEHANNCSRKRLWPFSMLSSSGWLLKALFFPGLKFLHQTRLNTYIVLA